MRRMLSQLVWSAVTLSPLSLAAERQACHGRTPVTEHPIVAEIHETRERLLEEYGMENLRHEFRAIEAEMKDRVVRLAPRAPIETKRRVS